MRPECSEPLQRFIEGNSEQVMICRCLHPQQAARHLAGRLGNCGMGQGRCWDFQQNLRLRVDKLSGGNQRATGRQIDGGPKLEKVLSFMNTADEHGNRNSHTTPSATVLFPVLRQAGFLPFVGWAHQGPLRTNPQKHGFGAICGDFSQNDSIETCRHLPTKMNIFP